MKISQNPPPPPQKKKKLCKNWILHKTNKQTNKLVHNVITYYIMNTEQTSKNIFTHKQTVKNYYKKKDIHYKNKNIRCPGVKIK